MKRVLVSALWLGCFALVTIGAQGQSKNVPAKGEGYHHLLMLDQREAVEHAKTLHYYVQRHKGALDHAVLMKHVDELGRNLQGMQEELAKVEETTTKGTQASQHLASIRDHQLKARTLFEQLKTEAEKPTPDSERLIYQSNEIYNDLRAASVQHNKAMTKLGVHQPTEPVR